MIFEIFNETRQWINPGKDAFNCPSVPTQLLVLCVLRILGRNWIFDDFNDTVNIGSETIRVFFHKFIQK